MGQRYTKFKSNYLMRSQRQHTDLGTLLERDWVTTNGLNVLRFGSGRKIWYNSGSFVFTTSNIPSYHKKHKLSTETTEWKWNDCKNADGTANTVAPMYNTTDLRNYAYYGSCVELIRATIEDIISDFPGRITSTNERPIINGERINDWFRTADELQKIKPTDEETSYDDNGNAWYYKDGWNKATSAEDDRAVIDVATESIVGNIYFIKNENTVKILKVKLINNRPLYYLEKYGISTGKFSTYYVYNEMKFYAYDYTNETFNALKIDKSINGFLLNNPFKIDLHHKKVSLGSYDNPMRFMSNSWNKYCIKAKLKKTLDEECCCDGEETNDGHCLYVGRVIGFKIEDKEESVCKSDNEGRILKIITFETDNSKIREVKVYGYYLNGSITYVYKPSVYGDTITIQPLQEYIDEYFNSLSGFKQQLLRQDTKPLYMNKFITPTEYDLVWYYPVKSYVWPSNDYCIDISSGAFTSFVSKLYDIGQNFDELWTDNLYRSMTHESIKNFDWSYSREYYEGDEQDNIDGGERLQNIIRVIGRVFDDIKIYIDTLKKVRTISYDKVENCPEALLSTFNDLNGFDVKSTIGVNYDIDANIDETFLGNVTKKNCWLSIDGKYRMVSSLGKWFSTRNSTDIYSDVADNEFMRRLSLSAKRIMQTKGTKEAIEMVFALFGFGDNDFTITEEAYYTEHMMRSDECIDGKIGDTKYGEDWTETTGVDWKDINSLTKGDLASEINQYKDLERLYYEDRFSGTPLREVYLGRKNNVYLLPYYDSTQLYDDNLIFQGKGGWGKMIKNNDTDPLDDSLDYQETLSYLHVAGTIGELLSINPNVVEDNDIYYVTSLSDYTNYDEKPPIDIEHDVTMSHYFILIDSANPNELYSWKNIVVKTELDSDGNMQKVDEDGFESVFGTYPSSDNDADIRDWKYPHQIDGKDEPFDTDTEKLGTYRYAFKKMQYLDNIFSTNLGNNPHVGYGFYDDGSKFVEYMKLPFKYLIDNSNLLYQNSSLYELSKNFEFEIYTSIHYLVTNNFTNEDVTYEKGDIIDADAYNNLLDDNKQNCKEYTTIQNDKIQLMNTRHNKYIAIQDIVIDNKILYSKGELISIEEYNTLTDDNKKFCNVYYESDYVRYKTNGENISKEFTLQGDENNIEKRWYINSKVLTIENKLPENNLFNDYFKSIIMPYVMQVIPSTAILKLKGFS